ncbi:MAG: ribosome biogenesis GTPase Der [Oscillospiraceae bacterium]|nr:ribosome biogenesis GTPase Der [Oscillospiraceae bacterium]
MSIVAIVGRPNVGKSALFNKLTGQRLSIVEDTPGVTRDRLFAPCQWRDRRFLLVDTGGLEPQGNDEMLRHIRRQAEIAIGQADVIVLVTDSRAGLTATDRDVAVLLQKSGKPVLVAVNKCDSVGNAPDSFYEFYALGLGDPIAVSAVHGHGTGDLLDAIIERLPADAPEDEDDRVKVAVIGRPNAGKSSLVNAIAGEERSIVSPVAGTTRDAVDTPVDNAHGRFLFIDTAGLRRQSRVDDAVEKYSVLRARMAVERADVCVLVMDGAEGFTEQDSKVAGLVLDTGKACVIAVNKWDAVDKDSFTMDTYRKRLQQDFSFMTWAPFVFISAVTGQRLDRLFELIKYTNEQTATRLSTGTLNEVLAQATARVPPPTDRGKRLRIYYMTQASVRPPTFVCFVNKKELFHFSYQRYLENQLRETFGFEGTPIRFVIREKGEER